jgi:DNA-binding transcriptional LysR family regulator
MFDWNDLRYLLAVARHGSTLAAGRALGLSQSTVHRRLAELERRLGQKLVTRTSSGYRLTDFGEAVLPAAEQVAHAVRAFEQQASDVGRDQVGVIRITCPEPIMYRIAQTGLLDRFHARHPSLRVEFVMSDKYLDLAKGDADVALRSGDVEDSELVGRKIADSLWAVYASRAYIERHGRPDRVEDLNAHRLIGLDETMAKHRAATWLRTVAPEAEIVAATIACWAWSMRRSRGSAWLRCRRRSGTRKATLCVCSARSRSSRGAGACSRTRMSDGPLGSRHSSTSSQARLTR